MSLIALAISVLIILLAPDAYTAIVHTAVLMVIVLILGLND